MTTVERIKISYNNAVKTKDNAQRDALKEVKAALANEAIALKRDLTEAETISVLKKAMRTRKDTAEQFYKGVDQIRYAQELYEANVILDFLPKDLDRSDVEKLLLDIADRHELQIIKKNQGNLVKLTVSASEGKTDGKMVSDIINELINGLST